MTCLCSCAREDAALDEPVRLRFWHAWGGFEGKFLDDLVAEFNTTHPHIRVEPSYFNIGDKLLASIAGGKPPDIATVWDFMLVPMGESGCFLPLEERLSSAGVRPDSFLPNVYEYGMYSRHNWGIPASLNATAIYYNRTLVREAGLNPDKPPRTIAELDEWSRRLTKRDANGNLERLGFAPSRIVNWMWCHGGEVFDSHARTFTLDDARNIEALTWMKSYYDEIGMDNWRRFTAGFGNYDSPQNPFFVGKVAMREDGQWFIQFLKEFAPDVDYGIFPFPPASDQLPQVSRVEGSFWVIPAGTKHPDEAWEFLRWLTAPEQSSRFCARLRNIPPLRASLEQPSFAAIRADTQFEFFVRLVLDGRTKPMPALPVAQQFNEQLNQGAESVFAGRREPAAFLRELNRTMNAELSRQIKLLDIEE